MNTWKVVDHTKDMNNLNIQVKMFSWQKSSKPRWVPGEISRSKALISWKPKLLLFIWCLPWEFHKSWNHNKETLLLHSFMLTWKKEIMYLWTCLKVFEWKAKCWSFRRLNMVYTRPLAHSGSILLTSWKPVECLRPNQIHVCSLEKRSYAFVMLITSYSSQRMRHILMIWQSSYITLVLT